MQNTTAVFLCVGGGDGRVFILKTDNSFTRFYSKYFLLHLKWIFTLQDVKNSAQHGDQESGVRARTRKEKVIDINH